MSPRRMSAREADRSYRVRNGTCIALWRAGTVRGRREGRGVMLSVEDLELHFLGASPCRTQGLADYALAF